MGVGLGLLLANYLYDWTGTYDVTLWAAMPMFAIDPADAANGGARDPG
jgi:hypothetical protein